MVTRRGDATWRRCNSSVAFFTFQPSIAAVRNSSRTAPRRGSLKSWSWPCGVRSYLATHVSGVHSRTAFSARAEPHRARTASTIQFRVFISAESKDAGKRLDHFLQERLPQFSRSRLQEWIKAGRVYVNHVT